MEVVHPSGCLLCDTLEAWHSEGGRRRNERDHNPPFITPASVAWHEEWEEGISTSSPTCVRYHALTSTELPLGTLQIHGHSAQLLAWSTCMAVSLLRHSVQHSTTWSRWTADCNTVVKMLLCWYL